MSISEFIEQKKREGKRVGGGLGDGRDFGLGEGISFRCLLPAQNISAASPSSFPSRRYSLPCRCRLSDSSHFSFRFPREVRADCRQSAGGEGQWIKGRVPEEDKAILPGRPQGSHHLPWDKFSIATKAVGVPGGGDWDGEFVFAKTAGGDFRLGATTNATAESRNV